MKTNSMEFVRELLATRKFAVANATGEIVKLPATEFAVLVTLANMKAPSHGPAIAEAADGRIPLASVYSALRRLQQKGFAVSETKEFEIASSTVRRTLWHATVTASSLPQKEVVQHAPLLPDTEASAVG